MRVIPFLALGDRRALREGEHLEGGTDRESEMRKMCHERGRIGATTTTIRYVLKAPWKRHWSTSG